MISEPTTILLEGEQATAFKEWAQQIEQGEKAIVARDGAIIAVLSAKIPFAERQGCTISLTETAVVVTPPVVPSNGLQLMAEG